VSAVNGVAVVKALYANVGFVVNAVVPPIFISTTVLPESEATTQAIISAPISLAGSCAYTALATSVPVAPIVQAIANFFISKAFPAYFTVAKLPAPVTIASPITVTVVFGSEYVDGILTIAHLCVESSIHLITTPFTKVVV